MNTTTTDWVLANIFAAICVVFGGALFIVIPLAAAIGTASLLGGPHNPLVEIIAVAMGLLVLAIEFGLIVAWSEYDQKDEEP